MNCWVDDVNVDDVDDIDVDDVDDVDGVGDVHDVDDVDDVDDDMMYRWWDVCEDNVSRRCYVDEFCSCSFHSQTRSENHSGVTIKQTECIWKTKRVKGKHHAWASALQKMRSSHPSQPEIFISNQASAFSVNLFAALAFTQESEYQFDVAICPSHDDRSSDSRKDNSYEYRNSLFPSSR